MMLFITAYHHDTTSKYIILSPPQTEQASGLCAGQKTVRLSSPRLKARGFRANIIQRPGKHVCAPGH